MDIEIRTLLDDILNAIAEIDSFFGDVPKDFVAFQNDLKTIRAVERDIEIIGEAMDRILQRDDSIQLSNSAEIIDRKDSIIHGDDSISDEIIWGIVTNYLPILKIEIEKLLDQ